MFHNGLSNERTLPALSRSAPSRFEEVDWELMLGQWKRKKMIVIRKHFVYTKEQKIAYWCLLGLTRKSKLHQSKPSSSLLQTWLSRHVLELNTPRVACLLPLLSCHLPTFAEDQKDLSVNSECYGWWRKRPVSLLFWYFQPSKLDLNPIPCCWKRTTYYPPSKALWTNKYPCLACASCQSQPCHLGSTAGY